MTDISEDPFVKKGKLYLSFVDNPGNITDPEPDAVEPDDNNNPKNRPGRCTFYPMILYSCYSLIMIALLPLLSPKNLQQRDKCFKFVSRMLQASP